jgi:small subunit ribosomal protein S11
MSRATRRLLAHPSFPSVIEYFPARSNLQCLYSRPFSKTSRQDADEKEPENSSSSIFANPSSTTIRPSAQSSHSGAPVVSQSSSKTSNLADLASIFGSNQAERANKARDSFLDVSRLSSIGSTSLLQDDRFEEPHHFHIYATRHNTHITLTKPNRDPLISVSAGNIGFRKGARKHYDTAFQLAGYVMGRIQEQGLNAQIKRLEVVLRGFGAGREAVTKALLGSEGKLLRGKVVKVSDSTRLKFGGTRSKKPRRLG